MAKKSHPVQKLSLSAALATTRIPQTPSHVPPRSRQDVSVHRDPRRSPQLRILCERDQIPQAAEIEAYPEKASVFSIVTRLANIL